MKTIRSLLAASALATIASAANATLWNVEMNASTYFAAANGPLNMAGFAGTWDDHTGFGVWTGTTSIPGFALIMSYSQKFTMNAETGSGKLNALDSASCTDNSGTGCSGFGPTISGNFRNTAVNPLNINAYKTAVPFVPTDGWTGQWTLQINKAAVDPDTGEVTILYLPIPMNVTLHAVPIPAAAWLFGSGLIGLIGTTRRKLQ